MPEIVFKMLLSLGITELFELLFAVVRGYRRGRELLLVAAVNLLTNPAVVAAYGALQKGDALYDCAILSLLECAAVAVEGTCYGLCSSEIKRPFLFSLCANAISFAAGIVISMIF